ncbi:MAG TPA: pseudouridine synthase [Candidatus Saccharimonadales bacterium]|nr:pseudouridine synthase [Candidatus Saccharimonadales bacterium]
MQTRLNKFLATRLAIGRRAADELIAAGKVLRNGVAAKMGERVEQNDRIEVNGKILSASAPVFLYVLMNKPAGYVCSRRQQGDTPTIYSLLPQKYQHLKTVGRLDKDSSGVILLTNDGDYTQELTHPKYTKIKKYEVRLKEPLQPLHHQMINDFGVDLPDGKSKLLLEGSGKEWLVTMHEGRNRQIRRTFGALGYDVARLHRLQFGKYTTSDISPGKPFGEVSKK